MSFCNCNMDNSSKEVDSKPQFGNQYYVDVLNITLDFDFFIFRIRVLGQIILKDSSRS